MQQKSKTEVGNLQQMSKTEVGHLQQNWKTDIGNVQQNWKTNIGNVQQNWMPTSTRKGYIFGFFALKINFLGPKTLANLIFSLKNIK